MKKHWSDRLVALGACAEAVEWARTQPSLAAAWRACERGDWMLWLLGRVSGPPESASRRALVLTMCGCERLRLDGPHDDLWLIEQWGAGRAGIVLSWTWAASRPAPLRRLVSVAQSDDLNICAVCAADSGSVGVEFADDFRRHHAAFTALIRQRHPQPPGWGVSR